MDHLPQFLNKCYFRTSATVSECFCGSSATVSECYFRSSATVSERFVDRLPQFCECF